ncbi:hypothetical protein Turpa_3468 [Turneriella parva DSM 21527]|uniref:Uncharacterized protein n=1 Tax=Turneriella parva (strain ATCC BAA-1111 / DSM 21527 / NCTC 11395 / H) TaxID=869212 RepID=I4B9Z8_TURPD|nr:hypothetical protein Turpa_3468 [Turneriella parva DSM 21527]
MEIRPAVLAGLTGAITSDNKIYELRSLRCRSSSGARPYVPKMPCARRPVGLHWRARAGTSGKFWRLNMQ